MNPRVSAILALALIVSGGATYLVYRVMVAKTTQATPVATTTVVMAARDLAIGTLIKDGDLKAAPWAGSVPKGAMVKKEMAIGRGVIVAMWEGEPVMENRLASTGAGGGLAAIIPPGMRAVAVRVDDIVGVAGFVMPGMRVDVLISGTPPGAQAAAGPKVKTILQSIQVLSAGQNYQKDNEGKPTVVPVVNLLVTPEQAEVLSLASKETRIQLVLRNPLDTQASKPPGVAMAGLFSDGEAAPKPAAAAVAVHRRAVAVAEIEPPAPKPAEKPVCQVEIINGALRSEAKFAHPAEVKQ